ncbi:GNAT family N-acetyltransferase [Kitasatospora sp. NPDC085895]|uniref:GNAT family N-acetyltransferase n=1 Tax=Kitasatospora sp. NPDC085895 TaxID=3155057 RepID=UPI00344CF295
MTRPAPARSTAPARAGGLRIHRTPETLAPYEQGWRELAAAAPGSSYFATPDRVLGTWETMDPAAAAAAEVALWTGPDGRPEAVVPLARTMGRLHPRIPLPVTAWTLLGADADGADHGLFPVAAHRREEVRTWLRDRTRRGSLRLPAMDPENDTALLPAGTRRIARTTCPRLEIGEGAVVGSTSFRRLMRRRERQLAEAGIAFRWVGPQDMTAVLLDAVLALHRLRQDHRGAVTVLGPHRRPLHLRLRDRADADRGPAALVAERGGTPVGAVYGFLWQDTFAYYNGGWDPAYARLGLGTVLLDRTIAAAAALGARTFDFLRGNESYKYDSFGASDRRDEQWLRPRGAGALAAGAVLRHARRRHGPA